MRPQEAHSGVIKLEDQDPFLVEKTLEYLYTGRYTFDHPLPPASDKQHSTQDAVEPQTVSMGISTYCSALTTCLAVMCRKVNPLRQGDHAGQPP
jgi:hypothetical protein